MISSSSENGPARGETTPSAPVWFDEFHSGLTRRTHFAVSGNLRDLYPHAGPSGLEFLSFEQVLWRIARERGFAALLVYDPADGLRLHEECGEEAGEVLRRRGIPFGETLASPVAFAQLHHRLTTVDGLPVVLLVDYANHLFDAPAELSEALVEADLAGRRGLAGQAGPTASPTIWLTDLPGDLPAWFVRGNDALREVYVELPNLEDRHAFARGLVGYFADGRALGENERTAFLEQFALEADGMTLVGMRQVALLARDEGMTCAQLTEAIRTDRLGTRRNPWKSPIMRARVLRARDILTRRVKGQAHAIEKALDILTRSIVGLSGAQTSSRHSRPRGMLFLVGPTGVGKTELAKAITELLFGDDTACHRFDMSEFMEENSINRLIGAPPGYPGHERGGELVNAMHRKPFSVVLFDEVEKAHPRVLDMFLQILDEGRLTDSRGSTAYFSEALIIFTSNIGMVGSDHTQNMGMNILPSDTYGDLERKLVEAVREHFRFELKRPELYNRLGQNIIAFEFIDGVVASQIFAAIMERVIAAVRAEHGVEVTIAPGALDDLRALCLTDWFEGGRGIANRIETHFINPLARAIFLLEPEHALAVDSVSEADGRTGLACSLPGAG